MEFWPPYTLALGVIMAFMTALWLVSIPLRNVSIIDLFWGAGFVVCAVLYGWKVDVWGPRHVLVASMAAVWGVRLSVYLAWRNIGKGEDFRYRKFREDAGEDRYWWYSLPTVFWLQGILMWLISAPLLGAQLDAEGELGILDVVAALVWLVGFIFEAGSDLQLAIFKSKPENKGKLLTSGFWRYTRHPNYFGDACLWWGFGLFSVAAGRPIAALGALFMTGLIVKVSGVALLEGSMKSQKPGYEEYMKKTSSFIPWFPKASS